MTTINTTTFITTPTIKLAQCHLTKEKSKWPPKYGNIDLKPKKDRFATYYKTCGTIPYGFQNRRRNNKKTGLQTAEKKWQTARIFF